MRSYGSSHKHSSVDCPRCVALKGERCITKNNERFIAACDAHVERVHKFKALEAAKHAAEVERIGEDKLLRLKRRYAGTNPDTIKFVKAFKALCRKHGVYIKLGAGSHIGLDDYVEYNLQSLDKLNVKEKPRA